MIRFWADASVALAIIQWLQVRGYEVLTMPIRAEGLTDLDVLNFSREDDRCFITNEPHIGRHIFRDRFPAPPAMIAIRRYTRETEALAELIHLIAEDEEMIRGYFVTIDRGFIRRRRLPAQPTPPAPIRREVRKGPKQATTRRERRLRAASRG